MFGLWKEQQMSSASLDQINKNVSLSTSRSFKVGTQDATGPCD